MAIWMACSRVILVDLVADSLGRDPCMDERGVWAGVEAADEVWFLEDLKKDMAGIVGLGWSGWVDLLESSLLLE